MSRPLAIALLLTACGPRVGDSARLVDLDRPGDLSAFAGDFRVTYDLHTTDARGLIDVEVQVEEGQTAFLLYGASDVALSVETVRAPSGEEVLDWADWDGQDETLTEATTAAEPDVVLQWPVRAEDGPLTPGLWTVSVSATDRRGRYLQGAVVETSLSVKSDPDLDAATVRVSVLLSAWTAEDREVRAAVDQAIERWAAVWAGAGLTLSATVLPTDAPDVMPYPDRDPDLYRDLSALGDNTDLTLIVAESLRWSGGTFGFAGGVPGPLGPSRRGAVVIGWLAHAGVDGGFGEEEVRLLGETMAHEAGHYMGLFHPVEEGWAEYDALGDTPRCAEAARCERLLGSNLMFPYPVCEGETCTPQTELTAGQRGVMQLYGGAL